MGFLAAFGLVFLIGKGVELEWRALHGSASYTGMLVALGTSALVAKKYLAADRDEMNVQFEDVPPPPVLALNLHRDGSLSG